MNFKKEIANKIYLLKSSLDTIDLPRLGMCFGVLRLVYPVNKEIDILEAILPYVDHAWRKSLAKIMPQEEQINDAHKKQFYACFTDTLRFLEETRTKDTSEYYDKVKALLIQEMRFNAKTAINSDEIRLIFEHIEKSLSIAPIMRKRLANDFQTAFRYCLFKYPELAGFMNSSSIHRLKDYNKLFIQLSENEFLQKLRYWEYRDGMLQHLYPMFCRQFSAHPPQTELIVYLSMIQNDYNRLFEQYNRVRHTKGVETISLINNIDINAFRDYSPLIAIYLNFIIADYHFFAERYDEAISHYTTAKSKYLQSYSSSVSGYIEVLSYLDNSIGWSQYKSNNYELDDAINTYKELFHRLDQSGHKLSRFGAAYRRNYGVVLENKKQYDEALTQYKKGLSCIKEGSGEFKLYVTYCSCLMKKWDIEFRKLEVGWLPRINSVSESIDEYLTQISIMLSYLDLAQAISPKFSDIYVQRIKVLTYKMLVLKRENGFLYETIIQNLILAEHLSENRNGYLFVKRDFYYALYLLDFRKKKNKWLNICFQINSILHQRNAGDSDAFCSLLQSIDAC